jgi:hypothetical protein
MGAMNWLAVVMAALAAEAVLVAGRLGHWRSAVVLPAMLVSAAMLGHAFARIGAATLAVKPWLYAMQSGGLALAFVIPALAVSHARAGRPWAETAREGAVWLGAYLAMGAVFYFFG